MTYTTNGEYQRMGNYLVGYRFVQPDGTTRVSGHDTPPGEWIGLTGTCTVPGCKCTEDVKIWHAAALNECKPYFQQWFRLVRILIEPEDLITDGQARRAFVQAISEPLKVFPAEVVWSVMYSPEKGKRKQLRVREQLQLTAPPVIPAPDMKIKKGARKLKPVEKVTLDQILEEMKKQNDQSPPFLPMPMPMPMTPLNPDPWKLEPWRGGPTIISHTCTGTACNCFRSRNINSVMFGGQVSLAAPNSNWIDLGNGVTLEAVVTN